MPEYISLKFLQLCKAGAAENAASTPIIIESARCHFLDALKLDHKSRPKSHKSLLHKGWYQIKIEAEELDYIKDNLLF